MSYQHTHWRDVEAWRKEGLPLSTTSNEAAKMFDASLTQVVAHLEDDSVGGLQNSITRMLQADPDFVMGHVLASTCLFDIKHSDAAPLRAPKTDLTHRELLHLSAAKELEAGNVPKAQDIWDDIVMAYPTDILALKMLSDYSTFYGPKERVRDSVARVFPHWKQDAPLYGYLFGLYAFGLEETNFYREAEKQARKGLELVPKDTGATHALAHVMEMEGRQDEGIKFMSETIENWKPCESLTCHNFWHWALYHIEKGEYEAALDIYDSEMLPRFKASNVFPLTDGSSLLYRVQLEGVDVGDRWQQLCQFWESHADEHFLAFNDSHMLMTTLGAKNEALTMKLLDSLRKYVRNGSGPNCEISREVGLPICEAFVEADKGNFDKAVTILKPLRYKVDLVGSSRAQMPNR
nr:tetratricopeptide repeat protein 38-like isoform X2 [Pocillopora verrucosa]